MVLFDLKIQLNCELLDSNSLKPVPDSIICNCLVVFSVLVTARLLVKDSSLKENRKLLLNDTGP